MLKSRLISCLIAFLGFTLTIGAKCVTASPFSIAVGETAEFYVYLESTSDKIVSLQMDIQLPEGLTLNTEKCTLTGHVADTEQQVFVGSVGVRLYRLVTTSYNFVQFPREKGTFLKISVTADKNFKGGTVSLKNMIAVNTSSKRFDLGDENITVKKITIKEGDINCDGKVNVSDVMQVANYLVSPNGCLCYSWMDVNKDTEINVTDVMTIVNLILKNN